MVNLIIAPEFRDKIPALTEAEFEQLRENILDDGEVYEPIVTWNNIIVDGHNRWKIICENWELLEDMIFYANWILSGFIEKTWRLLKSKWATKMATGGKTQHMFCAFRTEPVVESLPGLRSIVVNGSVMFLTA